MTQVMPRTQSKNRLLRLVPTARGEADVNRLDPTDETLMERVQQGDEGALTILYERYHQSLKAAIKRVMYDSHDIEEVLQDVFIQVWRRAVHYSPEKGRALGWLITMSRRRAIDRVRQLEAHHRVEELLRERNKRQTDYVDGDEDVEGRDLSAGVDDALAKIPAAQAAVVRLAFQRDHSHQQIRAQTGIPLGTVKTRIELGLRKLANSLRKWRSEFQ